MAFVGSNAIFTLFFPPPNSGWKRPDGIETRHVLRLCLNASSFRGGTKVSVRITCEEKEDSLKVALMWPKHGNEGEKEKSMRGEGVGSNQGRADRHLINTAQCPCYGQMYSTGNCTYRQTVL